MSQSLSRIYVHLIFHVKKGCRIYVEDLPALHAYISGVLKQHDSLCIMAGGVCDHVHVLTTLPRSMAAADLAKLAKGASSHWLKERSEKYARFAWQGGYAIFSVSQSLVEKTEVYIREQPFHHKRKSTRDEFIAFLESYNITYNEAYLFDE